MRSGLGYRAPVMRVCVIEFISMSTLARVSAQKQGYGKLYKMEWLMSSQIQLTVQGLVNG